MTKGDMTMSMCNTKKLYDFNL